MTNRSRTRRWMFGTCLLFAATSFTQAQEPRPEQSQSTSSSVHAPLTASARLNAARNVYLRRGRGSTIPYNVISSAFESWPRFTLVNSPEQADIIVEISGPDEASGVSLSGAASQDSGTGNSAVRVAVMGARNGGLLWMGSEQPHTAFRQRSREDKLVEASQRLFTKFHDRIEPPAAEKSKD